MKKAISILLVIIILLSVFTMNGFAEKSHTMNVLFLYCDDENNSYLNEYQHFQQSLVVNVEIEASSCEKMENLDLEDYDALYLHRTILQGKQLETTTAVVEEYVQNGGLVFVENELHTLFSKEFLGAASFEKLDHFPQSLTISPINENVKGIQSVIGAFHKDILEYYNLEELNQMDMGVTVTPANAVSLVDYNGKSLYTVNQFGGGKVLFLSKLLANSHYIQSFDMLPKSDQAEPFNFMFTTGSYLLKNELLSMLAKEKNGYSVSKVLGPNGRPAMAWQNHFEVLEAVKESSMEKWIDFLKNYNQIPSYSLAREVYDWGTWKEGVVYHRNIGTSDVPRYQGENAHSQYSSGQIMQLNSEPLSLDQYPAKPSLGDKIKLPYRAAIDFADLNHDGQMDMISGSASGDVFLFSKQKEDSEWNFHERSPLLLTNGEPVKVDGMSAPVVFDRNNDGLLDLIVGSEEGTIYYFEQNKNSFSFSSSKIMGNSTGVTVPTIGHLDEDEFEDLVIGNADGNLLFYKGYEGNGEHKFAATGTLLKDRNGTIDVGEFAAPKIVDYDHNGDHDLLVGMNDGFVSRFEWKNSNLQNLGFIEGNTYNQYGDKRLWGGRNSIPAIVDLDRDGNTDLLVGHLIFGYPIPIDSASFPYKEELQQSLQYAADHFIDIQPHLFFHSFKSNELEQAEIALHKKAFDAYRLEWKSVGTNQHTWRINNLDEVQTFKNQMANGIWWNSGFRPSNQLGEPTLNGHYLWTIPFLLANGERTENFIVYNPAPNIPMFEKVYSSYGTLDLPITHFYHMEYPILKESSKKDYTYKVEFLEQIRNQYDYNFVTEEQMNKSFLAAYKAESKVSYPFIQSIWNNIQNKVRTKQHHRFTIKEMDTDHDPKAEELMGEYRNSVGYKIELGDKYQGYVLETTADIYSYKDSVLYVSDPNEVNVFLNTKKSDRAHIVRANLPISIDNDKKVWTIEWKDAGLQQMKVYAPDGLELKNKEWKIEQTDNEHYVLTRFGDITELQLEVHSPSR